MDVQIADKKQKIEKVGFLDIEVDATIDLFAEIEKFKKEKRQEGKIIEVIERKRKEFVGTIEISPKRFQIINKY